MKTRRDLIRSWFVERALNVLPSISRHIQIGNPHGRAPTVLARPSAGECVGHFEGGDVYSFPNAVVSGHLGGLVITSQNQAFANLTQYHKGPQFHPGLVHIKVPAAKKLTGSAAYLCTPEATGNYYHWMVDVIPRLWLLEQAGITAKDLDYVFVAGSGAAWEIEPLLAHGFRPEQIRNLTKLDRVQVDQLWVPDRLAYMEFDLWKARFLHRLLLKEMPPVGKRLFCGRKDASRRRLVNERELFARLEPLGFIDVDPRGMTVREQAELFASASLIVGVQGAMLVNTVFMPAGGYALEIQSRTAPREFYTKIYAAKNIAYSVIYAEAQGIAVDDYDANLLDLKISDFQMEEIVAKVQANIAAEKVRT